jgi:hypothetical protein
MGDKLIRQAYDELAYLRLLLNEAEQHRLNTSDLWQRIAISEWRIKQLEWATFDADRT